MPSRPKAVRFAHENTVFYPYPPTPPQLALSSSTATPTEHTYSLPNVRTSQNNVGPDTITRTLHKYLSPSGISWDLRDPCSAITQNHQHLSDSHALSEPATFPPTDFIRIVSPCLSPWSIKVYPATHGANVTVRDVLDTIYAVLRTNVRPAEYAQLSAKNQDRASAVYQERYRRLRAYPTYQEEERRAGMKRVDFLMGHTHFVGLKESTLHPDEWSLLVS